MYNIMKSLGDAVNALTVRQLVRLIHSYVFLCVSLYIDVCLRMMNEK